MEKLQEAMKKVQEDGMSKQKTETIYGIPRKTLTWHMEGRVNKPDSLGQFDKVFSKEAEQVLVNHA